MLTTSHLLDAAKRAQNIGSEYRFARVLGIADNTLYNYRHGRTPDDERALKLAKMAGFDIGYALICMAAERTKDPEARASFLVAAAALEKAFPGQTTDILSKQFRTPDRPQMPMNTGSATMAKGVREYTSEQFNAPTSPALALLGVAWISGRRHKLMQQSRALASA